MKVIGTLPICTCPNHRWKGMAEYGALEGVMRTLKDIMKLWNARKSARTPILYFALALFTWEQCCYFSNIVPSNAYVETGIKAICFLAIVLVIALQDFSPKLYLLYGLLAVACILQRIGSGKEFWAFMVITILATRQEDITGVLRLLRKCMTVFLVVHTVWFFFRYFQGLEPLFTIDDAGRTRATLGLNHPNSLAGFTFNVIMLWVWERYDSIGLKGLAGLFLIETAVFALTNTRTAYLCGILLLLLVALAKYSGKAAAWINYVAMWITPVTGLWMLICSSAWLICPGNSLLTKMNSLLSRRVYLGAYAIQSCGFTLFGQPIVFDPVTTTPEWPIPFYTLDSAYLYCVCCVGIVWMVLICLCFYKLGKLRSPKISICLIMWALYSISEMATLNVYCFFPLLLISILFLPKEELDRIYPEVPDRCTRHAPDCPCAGELSDGEHNGS